MSFNKLFQKPAFDFGLRKRNKLSKIKCWFWAFQCEMVSTYERWRQQFGGISLSFCSFFSKSIFGSMRRCWHNSPGTGSGALLSHTPVVAQIAYYATDDASICGRKNQVSLFISLRFRTIRQVQSVLLLYLLKPYLARFWVVSCPPLLSEQ